jgi:hypothetical protein
VTGLKGHRKRTIVTAATVAFLLFMFAWEWINAPRVDITPAVAAQLEKAPPRARYLGKTFEGLALRRVDPFYYSNCRLVRPEKDHCHWLRVSNGRVTGSDPDQVARAEKKLRPLSADG